MDSFTQLYLFISLTYMAACISVFYFYLNRKNRKFSNRKKFFNILINSLKDNSIKELTDIVNIYKGIRGLSSEDITYRYGLTKTLRYFLVELLAENKNYFKNNLDAKTKNKWKNIITNYIEENDKISPYSDLPIEERLTLDKINTFLKNTDIKSAKQEIHKLSGLFQARYDDFKRIEKINNWSVPLAITGFILTILFGIS